jgi:hypothetical protein
VLNLTEFQVVDYLEKVLGISRIILWGRSMGAVSAIRYLQMLHAPDHEKEKPKKSSDRRSSKSGENSREHPKKATICGLILDSPFSSLWKVSEEVAHARKHFLLIGPVIHLGLLSIRSIVSKKAGFDIKYVMSSFLEFPSEVFFTKTFFFW